MDFPIGVMVSVALLLVYEMNSRGVGLLCQQNLPESMPFGVSFHHWQLHPGTVPLQKAPLHSEAMKTAHWPA